MTFPAGKDLVVCSSDPNDPDVVDATILDGDDSDTLVTFDPNNSADTVLSGLTITDGTDNTGDGGGIEGNGCSATITNCVINANVASGGGGGGINDCDGLISGCWIDYNTASSASVGDGGGLAGCDGTIAGCTIVANTTYCSGGGGVSV